MKPVRDALLRLSFSLVSSSLCLLVPGTLLEAVVKPVVRGNKPVRDALLRLSSSLVSSVVD